MSRPEVAILRYIRSHNHLFLSLLLPYTGQCLHIGSAFVKNIKVFSFGDVKIEIKIKIRLMLKVYIYVFFLLVGVLLLPILVDICQCVCFFP
jgi:hypothetical protein